jgi:hypothetical protein
MEPRQLSRYTEGEYGALVLPDAWHVASLACFAAALGARFLVRLLPVGNAYFGRVFLPGFAVFALAGLGLLFGLLGLRTPHGRGMAKMGVLLNVIVLVLSGLAVAAFFYILPE